MKSTEFKGAVFDLDGTLLDSMSVWHSIDGEFFKRRSIAMPADYCEAIKTMHFPTAAAYTKERFSLPESVKEIMDEWRSLCFGAYRNDIKLKSGVFEYLRQLRESGVKIAYATSNSEELSKAALSANGVWELFSAKAYSEETGKNKTEPDVYLLAAERLGLKPSECAVFEDILVGVKSAKKGGFTVYGVYDETSEKDTAEIKRYADRYIKSFEELL